MLEGSPYSFMRVPPVPTLSLLPHRQDYITEFAKLRTDNNVISFVLVGHSNISK